MMRFGAMFKIKYPLVHSSFEEFFSFYCCLGGPLGNKEVINKPYFIIAYVYVYGYNERHGER